MAIIIDSRGKDVAALVPVAVAEQWQRLNKILAPIHKIKKAATLAGSVPGVREIILFGSYARGDANGRSDIDLLVVVEGEEAYGETYSKVERLLLKALRPFKIELIPVIETDWQQVEPGDQDLYSNVLLEGKVLFSHGKSENNQANANAMDEASERRQGRS